jgi:hypothetical protein
VRGRLGRYEVSDFLAVLVGYALSGERTVHAYYDRLTTFATPFMALFERRELPHRATLSRFLAAVDTSCLQAWRTLCAASSTVGWTSERIGGVWDRQGQRYVVIDVDATREAARSVVARTLAQPLLELAAHITEREAASAELLKDDAEGQQLRGIPGIGPQGAATIRAELGAVTRCGRIDEVVASAGLDPRTRQSGAFVGQQQLSKRGPGALRQAHYLAAMVAARCRPEWRSRSQRLLDRGRAKKEAYTILARALLRIIYHLLRTGDAYDPALLNRQPAPAGG